MPRFTIVGFTSLILSSLSFFASNAVAQNSLKDSKLLINKGIELFEEDKYKEALTYFLQVPEGDTNFSTAKYETVLTYLADSAFERSTQVAFEGMKLTNSDKRQLLYLVAHAYDYRGKTDSAVYFYDSLARAYPTDNLAYYEKSVVYYQKHDFDKAIQLLEKALMINPYHYRSHAVLGNIYLQQGRLTEAFMASAASLLFTNDAKVASGAITSLGAIARQSQEVSDYYDQRKDDIELYNEIDEIIHAKLALNKGYNITSVMGEENIVKVAHAIMEKLSYDKRSTNFAMQYYVPLFQEVYQKGMFDPFMLLLFSNYGIEVVEQYAKKQKRDMSEVKKLVFPYWDHVISTRTLEYYKREKAPMLYAYNQNSGTYIVGNLVMEKGDIAFREGHTKLYDDAHLVAEGKFNNNGNKEGLWRYYYSNGILRLTETYKNGVIQGEAHEYRNNGFLSEVRKYNNSGELTEEQEYTYNGILDNTTIIQPDKENEVIAYHLDGRKQTTLKVKNGSLVDGKYKWFYSNGSLEKEMEILDGKTSGEYKEYYDNGRLKEHGIYRKGDRDGLYTTYYENGKKESELNYKSGEGDGEQISYNERGQVISKTAFKGGKRNGKDIRLSDEREYYIIDYKNDVPIGYTFKGPDGREIKEASKNLSSLKVYYANGNLKADLPLKEGMVNGQAKYYFNTGSLREVVNFEDDIRDGTAKEYYKNGKLYMVSEYVKGEHTGSYKGYYINGQLQGEGWLINDKKEGIWRFYNVAGKLEREAFYLNNQVNGPSRHYDGNGKIKYMDYYDRDLIVRMEQYNNAGKIVHEQSFSMGTGKYYFIFPNGNISFEAQLKNGQYEGAYTSYYPDKTVKETGFYKNGERDSFVISYFPGGQESSKGHFRNGRKDGKWTHHSFDGKLERETDYVKGDEHGKDKVYLHGELRHEYNMDYDYMDGDQIFYGEGKKIALVHSFKEHCIIGYTYESNDGKLQPLVPVKNGTAKIVSYYPNGKKAMELNMRENMYEGKMTTYYSNGNVADEKTYSGRELNGPFKCFYLDGKPSYEATYKDDVLNGEEKLYGANGKLLIHANFVMGEQHGPQMYSDPKTGRSYKLTYEHGALLTMENLSM
ncbi:tetratricopeptide repeat protein [Polluticoccus soli]|uniref:tetratricopeptide repeat protein n=1 Tax=Polluticoccus soli TaxID=3034150 RepID=UPI0023E22AAD|nr:tetratricopeptide repeat protein [Flavipsychrobacter sp. JY13-12]